MKRLHCIILALAISTCFLSATDTNIAFQWTLAWSETSDGTPRDSIHATVPGCVQADWARAKGLPSILDGNNEALYAGLEDRWWHYTTSAEISKSKNTVPYLYLEAVDYAYDLIINGKRILSHEGMFTPTTTDLSAYRGQHIDIEVLVKPAPKSTLLPYYRGLGNEACESCKPAFNYGWDWCPRYVTLGIVGDAYISYKPTSRIASWDFTYSLSENLDKVTVDIEYELAGKCDFVKVMVSDPEGIQLTNKIIPFAQSNGHATLVVKNPRLWWPWNHGDQPLYYVAIGMVDKKDATIDAAFRNVGFRRIRLVSNQGDKLDYSNFPMPATFEVNGRRIFVKGSNWVPSELCRADVKTEDLKKLLGYVRECNMNILRLWGGAYLEPDSFYEICDKLGIMVWQEFPLACAKYSEEDSYLKVLEQESEFMIRKLRNHGCLALWCGGNELFFRWKVQGDEIWGGMSLQSKALRLLDSQSYRFDPNTPYWFTSPQTGIKHGGYFAFDGQKELLTEFYDSKYMGYTEFGCGALSEYDIVSSIVTELRDLRKPFAPGSIWEARHANLWGNTAVASAITGKDYSGRLKEACKDENDIQSIVYKCAFESCRHKWPYTTIATNWCYNEPWTTLAGNGLVNYSDGKEEKSHRRPSYYAVQQALRPTMLSISLRQISWTEGQKMELGAWLLNDSGNAVQDTPATIEVILDGAPLCSWDIVIPGAGQWSNSRAIENLSLVVPCSTSGRMILKISTPSHPEWSSEYKLFIKNKK